MEHPSASVFTDDIESFTVDPLSANDRLTISSYSVRFDSVQNTVPDLRLLSTNCDVKRGVVG